MLGDFIFFNIPPGLVSVRLLGGPRRPIKAHPVSLMAFVVAQRALRLPGSAQAASNELFITRRMTCGVACLTPELILHLGIPKERSANNGLQIIRRLLRLILFPSDIVIRSDITMWWFV
jgi:hypothetical protein